MAKRMTNAHTHTFTHKHVPPYLAKKIIPWPLYYLVPMSMIVSIVRFFSYGKVKQKNALTYEKVRKVFYRIRFMYNKFYHANFLTYYIICPLIWIVIFLPAVIVLSDMIGLFIGKDFVDLGINYINTHSDIPFLKERLPAFVEFVHDQHWTFKLLVLLIGLVLFQSGRNLVAFLLSRLKFLPGKETRALYMRYINIAQFAKYETQNGVLDALTHNFPDRTRFIVLPMDMDYMQAGKCRDSYPMQLKELAALKDEPKWKDILFPFIFAHPERISKTPGYADEIKTGLTKGTFAGIKLYPALGYFPFEKELLPTYLFAAENGIPIITHCIRGVIYYRGKRKKAWYTHPLIKNRDGSALELYSFNNSKFATHFTHPLNYLFLLEPYYLMQLLDSYNDPQLDALFEYNKQTRILGKDLKKLKLCFGHFGGEDEWRNYLEHDRTMADQRFMQHPDSGIDFLDTEKILTHYFGTSWYTIIRSMMYQYENVYADISFILHDIEIISLLKETLRVEKVRDRVLFGTDFYVVRNHGSDKELYLNLKGRLSEADFERIACDNPDRFLTTRFFTA